jgi:hypothetical protein
MSKEIGQHDELYIDFHAEPPSTGIPLATKVYSNKEKTDILFTLTTYSNLSDVVIELKRQGKKLHIEQI